MPATPGSHAFPSLTAKGAAMRIPSKPRRYDPEVLIPATRSTAIITSPDRVIDDQGRRGPCGRTTAKAAPDRRGHSPYQKSGSVHCNARIDERLRGVTRGFAGSKGLREVRPSNYCK